MPAEAFAIHGLSDEFLKDKPLFAEVADDLIAFLGDAPLVIHNAGFDIGFLNAELERAGRPLIARERMVDTLLIARRKHPGGIEPARRSVRRATRSTIPAAPSTARCSMPNCWPRFMSN